MNLSLRNKTIVSIAIIEAILLLTLIFTAVNFMRDSLNEDLAKRSSIITTLFASTTKNAVLTYDLASLESYCIELMKNPDIAYVRLLNSKNKVLAEAGDKQYLERIFLQDKKVDLVDDGIFDNFAEIKEGEYIYGRVELGIDISNIELSVEKIQNWTTFIALIEMLLVGLFSFVLGSYLTRQLQGLRVAAREMTQDVENGNFNHRTLPVTGKDELSEVTEAFNKLMVTLETEHARTEEYQKDLEVFNHTLEEKVKLRTILINERNEQLELINKELHETQQQLIHAEKMASIGQLAAGIAHEINNPIGFVSSNLDSLKNYTGTYRELSKQVQQLLDSKTVEEKNRRCQNLLTWLSNEDLAYIDEDTSELITESVEGLSRVNEIVKGLKQFSRLGAEDKKWFDVNECILTTIKGVSNELKDHCTINQDLAELPKVWINVGKITRVLTNLLINAGQAINEQGEIIISSALEKDHVVISIKDTGCGISADNINKIFDPFFTTKDVGQGTGLGLSISYGIIQDHGGRITVSSQLNEGACFRIILPINSKVQYRRRFDD